MESPASGGPSIQAGVPFVDHPTSSPAIQPGFVPIARVLHRVITLGGEVLRRFTIDPSQDYQPQGS